MRKPISERQPIVRKPMTRTPIFDDGVRKINHSKIERMVARVLGIAYGDDVRSGKLKGTYLWVGTTGIADNLDAIEVAVAVYQLDHEPENLCTFAEYRDACKRVGSIRSKLEQHEKATEQWEYQDDRRISNNIGREPGEEEPPRPYPTLRLSEWEIEFAAQHSVATYTEDASGYLEYLKDFAYQLYLILDSMELEVWLKSDDNNPHSYILGTTGSGKTELMKLPIHTIAENKKYGSVVALDPAGEFVKQVAKWKEFVGSDRLVYLRPNLASGKSPVINPFQISGVEAGDYSQRALDVKEVVGQELVDGLGQMISESGAGSILTLPMRQILQRCIQVLLDRHGSTLDDLKRFMIDENDRNHDLVEFGKNLPHHAGLREYFEDGFKGNRQTKESIYKKLDSLLGNRAFRRFTCGRNTIDLEEAVNAGKIILFDLGRTSIGQDAGPAVARMVVSLLVGIAMRRDMRQQKDLVPVTLVVDECHNYLSPSMEKILTEARKYQLFLTLGQQMAGYRMTREMQQLVFTCCNLQFSGGAPESAHGRNSEMLGVDRDAVRMLEIGEFYTRARRQAPTFKLKTRTDLLGYRNSMDKFAWRRVVSRQVRTYYRDVDEETTITAKTDGKTVVTAPKRRRRKMI